MHYGEILKIISRIKYSINKQLENNMNSYIEKMGKILLIYERRNINSQSTHGQMKI